MEPWTKSKHNGMRNHQCLTALMLQLKQSGIFACGLDILNKAHLLLKMGAKRASDELLAAVVHDTPELTKWLVETGAALEARDDPFLCTPLMIASSCGATKNMQVLIEAGADVNAQDKYRQTALIYAKNAEAVRILVTAGADKDHIDGMGDSRLKSAAENGQIEVVKTMLELGADPNVSSTGETPLHRAIGSDQLEIAQLLLEAGADPNRFDIDGWYPLMEILDDRCRPFVGRIWGQYQQEDPKRRDIS